MIGDVLWVIATLHHRPVDGGKSRDWYQAAHGGIDEPVDPSFFSFFDQPWFGIFPYKVDRRILTVLPVISVDEFDPIA